MVYFPGGGRKVAPRFKTMILSLSAFVLPALAAEARPLVVTGDSDSAPYISAGANGEAIGFDADFMREIARRKGLEIEFSLKPWRLALRDLCLKKADILLGAVQASSFAGTLDYSMPYCYDRYAIFAKSGFKYGSLGELTERKAGIPKADPVLEMLLIPAGAVREKIWAETFGMAFKDLAEGSCAYVAAPCEIGLASLKRMKPDTIAISGPTIAPCVRRFAIRKEAAALLATLDEGIATVKAEPVYEELRQRWLNHEPKSIDRSTVIRYGLYVFIPLVLALDGLLIWSIFLKRQVRRKSRDLQESRGNYKMLFDGVSDAILVSDAKGRIIEFNKGAAKLFAQEDGASLAGRNVQELLGTSAIPASDGTAKSMEASFKRPSGEEVFLELSSGDAMIGRRKFTVTIARDASERKLAEKLKADVERMARHDLKGPLNGIVALPELLRMQGPLNEQQQELVKLIEDSGMEMLGMINLAQDMYKIEKGVYELRPAPLNLSPMVTRLLIETRPLAGARHIATEISIDGKPWQEISPFRVMGEETLCRSMLSNLLKNAMEASPENATVSIELLRGDDVHRIKIHNRGAVPRDIRDKFFDKYASSGKKGGTGFGTYNAMLIAKLHHGDIKMETSEQDGTTLTVSLPAVKEL
jgi:PAS domain S-box-containing protein